MTDKRSTYHHGSLPDVLVATALELLDEGGMAGVSVRETARRAGVSPGAPFRHFADREALLNAVAGRVLDGFVAWQRAALADARPDRTAMWTFGRAFVMYAASHTHRFELLRKTVYGGQPAPELREGLEEIDRLVTGVVTSGQRAGELRSGDPALVTLTSHALVYGLSQMIVDGFLPAEHADRLVDQVLDTFGAGIVLSPEEKR
ncbi:TetR/AcrR family transcriptional regulator [Actinomadura rubteroloni]|uniref:TetR/AcrR family transcriptional regulator n=1 Tax=Actinomadura rubteroloni TaxID=1926885 RepID=UPI00196BA60A|nr:TetR/AcrR family transcriptional regulator [Actinomadura rubteroloni]